MTVARLFAACVVLLLLLLLSALVASAGPGDPRLVNGVLEWPPAVASEPFVVVRGDDGVLYYVAIAAARRDSAVTAGSRISVLGMEGRNPHELTAVGIGSGATAEAALAQLQGVRQPASAAPAGPAPSAPPTVPTDATVTPAAPKATVPPTPAVRQPDASSPKSPMIDARPPASGAAAAVVPASTPATTAAQSPAVATAPMLVPTDEHRWVEITGEVEAFAGRTLVLKVDGGRVSVDLSSLRANLERIVIPGSTVKVYGVPIELRFKAMGFIDPDARPRSARPN